MIEEDKFFMNQAIQLALLAEKKGNLPVGAVITHNGELVAEGSSAIWVPRFDATRHAEMEAIRALPPELWNNAREMNIYTTLEPCLMCFGAILLHGIGRVVYGASDDYGGTEPVVKNLPLFFHEGFAKTEWVGPLMPEACDPLHDRLLVLEKDRKESE